MSQSNLKDSYAKIGINYDKATQRMLAPKSTVSLHDAPTERMLPIERDWLREVCCIVDVEEPAK